MAAIGELQASAVIGDHEKNIAAGTRASAREKWFDEEPGKKDDARRLEQARQHAHPNDMSRANIRPNERDEPNQANADRPAQPLPAAEDDFRYYDGGAVHGVPPGLSLLSRS